MDYRHKRGHKSGHNSGLNRRHLLGWAAGLALPAVATAAAYPTKPIRMIVPFPPGGATDIVARRIAAAMERDLGQTIIVDNRAGAGAVIGAEAASKADPDGYTLLATTAGVHIVNPAIYGKLPYDPVTSFTPVSQLVSAPLALTVTRKSPFKTAQELIAYAKAHPGKLTYGSAGNGSSLHQNGEMFKDAAGVDILHVPYKGAAPAVNDLRAGLVDMTFSYVASVMPFVRSGDFRLLDVGSPKRLEILPDVPTVAEVTGKAGFDSDTWTGIAAPAGTPAAIVTRLNAAAQVALKANQEYLVSNGYVILGGTPQAMAQRIDRELKTITPLLAKVMGQIN